MRLRMEEMERKLQEQAMELNRQRHDAPPPLRSRDSQQRSNFNDNKYADVPPSRVLHLRNTPKDVTRYDIEVLFEDFGPCVKICILPNKPQALVQLPSVECATRAIEVLGGTRRAQIRGHKIYFNYSHRNEVQEINNNNQQQQQHQQQHQQRGGGFNIYHPRFQDELLTGQGEILEEEDLFLGDDPNPPRRLTFSAWKDYLLRRRRNNNKRQHSSSNDSSHHHHKRRRSNNNDFPSSSHVD
uniref:RRM domain-containing protein n=1 Tax=Aureoumbra lagunensis TaxID=44058 RepID=A0A7S3JVR6_9STRA